MKKMDAAGDATPPSMKQVAEAAGVAVSTVSRALATPDRVNAETRKRILAAARELGFTPNAAARTLRMGRSNVIMIVLPGQLYYGASQVIPLALAGIDAELTKHGFNPLIANLDREQKTEAHILDLASSGMVDGALVLSSRPPRVGDRVLGDTGLPVVGIWYDISNEGIPSVITNEIEIMDEVTESLIAEGHRRFLYIGGPATAYHEHVRLAGIRQAMARHGLADSALTCTAGTISYQEGFDIGYRAAQTFIELPEKPTAALCCSDDAALAFMQRMLDAGFRVPDDIAIVGFDGAAVGTLFRPALSTVVQPAVEMGRKAAELMVSRLRGAAIPDRTVIASSYVRRGSA